MSARPTSPKRRTEGIRPYTPEDSDRVVHLYRRMFLGGLPIEDRKRAFVEGFFSRWLFEDPWRRDDLPSLVYESPDGEVTGFLGIIPRQLHFGGALIDAAIATAFMVDPSSRPAAIALLSKLLSGPQDLTLTDGASDQTRRILDRMGFQTHPSMSVNWFRVFRPSNAVLSRFTRSATPAGRLLAAAARPVCDLIDRGAARVSELGTTVGPPADVRSRPLATTELLHCIESATRHHSIRPAYDERSLRWVLDLRARATHRGSFRSAAVENVRGDVLGWYLCHLQRDGTSEIIQIGSLGGAMEPILGRALYDCMAGGSALVQGRLEMTFLKDALVNDCLFRPAAWILTHSRDPAITAAFASGDVYVSGLEIEQPW
jgi:hypothetical protein